MRKSFDGLVGLVRDAMREDPLSGSLFVFVNRRGNYLKLVYWDRTGYALFAKRLEQEFSSTTRQNPITGSVPAC
jgi:transposase